MQLTQEQLKGKINNKAKESHADARAIMRIYMMERFLERMACSKYKDNFILKGGMLVISMVGTALRSTMDIDTTMRNQKLSVKEVRNIVEDIIAIRLDDGISFDVKEVFEIMDKMEYPGVRVTMNAKLSKLVSPFKIDISTGDVITPHAIEREYKLLLDKRIITLWTYNLETILAEKLQTSLVRANFNTRMRDFYDIKILLSIYEKDINAKILKKAFMATCKNRETEDVLTKGSEILTSIRSSEKLQNLWASYQKKYSYAADIQYADVIESITILASKCICSEEMLDW